MEEVRRGKTESSEDYRRKAASEVRAPGKKVALNTVHWKESSERFNIFFFFFIFAKSHNLDHLILKDNFLHPPK